VCLIRRSSQATSPQPHQQPLSRIPARAILPTPAIGDLTANLASRHGPRKRTFLMSVIGFVDMSRPLCGVILRVDCRGRRD
jgi:hypothetical protein